MNLRIILTLLLLAVVVSGVVPAAEQELSGSLGLRGGGEMKQRDVDGTTRSLDVSAAISINYGRRLRSDTWFTAFWSHQQTEFDSAGAFSDDSSFDLDIDYLHAGGTYRPERDGRAEGFVTFTMGLTWYRPERAGFGDEYGFSLSAGGGTQIPLSPRCDLRLAARGYVTFTSARFGGQCASGGCTFSFTGEGTFQLEGLVGIVFRL